MRRPRTLSHARARTAPRTPLAAVPLVALGLLLAACGGSTSDTHDAAAVPVPEATSTTEAPTTSTTTLTDEELVTTAYISFLQGVVDATQPGAEPDALQRTASGAALTRASEIVSENAAARTRLEGSAPDSIAVSVREVQPTATGHQAAFCLVDSVQVRALDGDLLLNDLVVASDVLVTFSSSATGLRVSEIEYLSRAEGMTECVGY
jgi:hypothetical protein